MTQTMAVLYLASTLAGLLVALGSELGPLGVALAVVEVGVGLTLAAVLVLRGDRLPRAVLRFLVGVGAAMIAIAVLVPPEPLQGLALALLTCFVVVQTCYFFPPRPAMVILVLVGVLGNGALLLRGDVSVFTVLGLDCVLVALAVVARRLAARASDATVDPLTGLHNRRAFDDLLQEMVRGGGTLSVALLDLDHFKEINDTAGHEAGDRVLLRVAALPQRYLPPGAVLARQGGDEFALLLPRLDGPAAVVAVWRICDALAGTGLSAGVAQYEPGESAAQLVRRADGALYAAKAAGRGRVELAGAPTRSAR